MPVTVFRAATPTFTEARHPWVGPASKGRCARAGKHYVFYRIEGDTVRVSRILHEKMDFSRHLN